MAKKIKTLSWWEKVRNLWQDERTQRIFSLLCFMSAVYMLIATISYFFTWRTDQDKVLQLSWRILFQSTVTVDNLLGRLGALVAHFFIYYGFGIAALLIVPILAFAGVCFAYNRSWWSFLRFTINTTLIMFLSSLILEFIFKQSAFPYGGALGERSCFWLSSFVGQIGLAVLLLFINIAVIVWVFNPGFLFPQLSVPAFGTVEMQFPTVFNFFKTAKDSDFDEQTTVPTNSSDDLSQHGSHNAELDINDPFYAHDDLSKKLDNSPIPESSTMDNNPFVLNFDPENTPLVANKAFNHNAELEIANPDSLETEHGVIPKDTEQSDSPGFSAVPDEEDRWVPENLDPYDQRASLSMYQLPSLDLLDDYADQKGEIDRSELEANKDQIISTLLNYKIEIQKIRATIGPTVTLYEIVPAPGIRISKIKSLEDDIALSLSAQGIRIIAPIPGRGTIGIEVANKNKNIVPLKELLRSDKFNDPKMDLPIALGKTISNEVFVADLAKMPHLLIAGATGQGKSVGLNSILMSLLYRKHPSEVKLVLIDPKKVELPIYSEITKHYLAEFPGQEEAIITDTSKVIYTLNSLCIEMDQRYELLKLARVRNLKEYNEKYCARKLNPEKGHKYLPFLILIIDEFADLIMTAGKEVEMPIGRLAQLARAVGIHLIIATQRPSVKIITGLIKANFPARIAFKVSSNIDSRTILDFGGAERLIGRGDMLVSTGNDLIRLQCPFVDTPEVEKVIKHIKTQPGFATPYMLPEFRSEEAEMGAGNISASDLDDMFDDAARLVVQSQHGSTSMIQRRLKLGYNRAGRIMDQLEAIGIVSAGEGSRPRDVLVFNEVELENILNNIKK